MRSQLRERNFYAVLVFQDHNDLLVCQTLTKVLSKFIIIHDYCQTKY